MTKRTEAECDEGETAAARFTAALKAVLSVGPKRAAEIRSETAPGAATQSALGRGRGRSGGRTSRAGQSRRPARA